MPTANKFGEAVLWIVSDGRAVSVPINVESEPILVMSYPSSEGLICDRAYEILVGAGGGLKLETMRRPIGGHAFDEIEETDRV